MMDVRSTDLSQNNVVSFPEKSQKTPSLKELAQDPDVREFLRIAHKHKLRIKALEIIKKKLN